MRSNCVSNLIRDDVDGRIVMGLRGSDKVLSYCRGRWYGFRQVALHCYPLSSPLLYYPVLCSSLCIDPLLSHPITLRKGALQGHYFISNP